MQSSMEIDLFYGYKTQKNIKTVFWISQKECKKKGVARWDLCVSGMMRLVQGVEPTVSI